jgi:hypothetical protein
MRGWILAAALALVFAAPLAVPALAQDDTASTKERKEKEKDIRKKDKQFNREIKFRRVVGPNVLPVGPFSVSVFVNGQPMEARIRVAIQANSVDSKISMDSEKWAVQGIVYPQAVKLFEDGRPDRERIELFKMETQKELSKRFPDMIDAVYIESMM